MSTIWTHWCVWTKDFEGDEVNEEAEMKRKKKKDNKQKSACKLLSSLTEPKFQGKIVVILAGYEHDMDSLMRVNQGLRR